MNQLTLAQQDAHFMGLALKQADAAVASGQTPFGAVVVNQSGQLVGEGHNTVRADGDPAAHGEVVAIRDAWRRLGSRRAQPANQCHADSLQQSITTPEEFV